MNIFYSADLHFSHNNIIKYCNRPFATVDEMDETLISNWNGRVQPKDMVWILGDVFFCDETRADTILRRLNGRLHLLYGNHDTVISKSPDLQRFFTRIYPSLYHMRQDGINIVMCHYPMLSWDKSHYGSFMLHGHVHNSVPLKDNVRRYDVGVDANNYAPVSWDEVRTACNAVEVKPPTRTPAT